MAEMEPRIGIICDVCDYEDDFGLTALAGGGWDARNLPADLVNAGWKVDGDRHVCPDCVEAGNG